MLREIISSILFASLLSSGANVPIPALLTNVVMLESLFSVSSMRRGRSYH